MTREQVNKSIELVKNIENVEKVLKFLQENTDNINFAHDNGLFPTKCRISSAEISDRLKIVIIDTLDTISKELEDELAKLLGGSDYGTR